MDLRIPPNSLDVERSILASCMCSESAWIEAQESIVAEQFYHPMHQKVFKAMVDHDTTDIIALCNHLENQNIAAVDISTIAACASTPTIAEYVRILREKYQLREIIRACGVATTESFNPEENPLDVVARFEKAVIEPMTTGRKGGAVRVSEILPAVFEEIDGYLRGISAGIPTGIIDLDKSTGGLQKGDLIVIAGRPSMGKTALALNILQKICVSKQVSALMFSLEMTRNQIIQRMLCTEARMSLHALRAGLTARRELPRLSEAAGPMNESPLYIDDTAGQTVREMRTQCRITNRKSALGLVVVDYIQLAGVGGSGRESRNEQVSAVSRGLKNLAKEFNCPVVALSQLSRDCEKRTDKRPMLSDLRDSGAIEQDADVVMFLYRDHVYNESTPDSDAEIIISKQRNGPTGTVKVFWDGLEMRFKNIEKNIPEQEYAK